MTSRGQCPTPRGCVLVNVFTPPPPFRKSCIRAWPEGGVSISESDRLTGDRPFWGVCGFRPPVEIDRQQRSVNNLLE